MRKLIVLPAALLIASCATTSTGPVPAGTNTYMISLKEGAFPSGREPLLANALKEAGAHCESMGKTMKLLSSGENSGPIVLGNYPKATIVYSCEQSPTPHP